MWSIEWRHFNDLERPLTQIAVTPLFDAEYLRDGTKNTHSYNEIQTGNYTRPAQVCHFKQPRVISSELAKYSMTAHTQCCSEYSSSSSLLELKKARALFSSSSCSIVLKNKFLCLLLANCNIFTVINNVQLSCSVQFIILCSNFDSFRTVVILQLE